MDYRNIFQFLIILSFEIIFLIFGQHLNVKYKNDEYFLNDTCTVDATTTNGICRYLQDCPEISKSWNLGDETNRPTICRFENRSVIVCCPSEMENLKKSDESVTLGNSKFIRFNEECPLPDGKGNGKIRLEKHCPYAMEKQLLGIQLPRACPYGICSDMVCCPDTPRTRLRKYCWHEDAGEIVRKRIYVNFNCRTPDTNQNGRYTEVKHCSYYSKFQEKNQMLPKICDWDMCEGWVCCPENHLANSECRTSGDYNYDHIDFDAGSCKIKDTGAPGICTSQQICKSQSYHRNINYTSCGKDCCEDFVCCPFPDLTKISRNERACFAYKNAVFEDTKEITYLDPKIDKTRECFGVKPSGGEIASAREFPHMAVLGYESGDGVEWNCGGSLLSDRFVLTAGHCLLSSQNFQVKYVRVGIVNLNISVNHGDCPEEYIVIERIPHFNYSSQSVFNDIALLRLDRKVKFNSHIRPICLPTSAEIPEHLWAIGFGLTSFNGNRQEQLISVYLNLFTEKECTENYKLHVNRKFTGLRVETQFCAGSHNSVQDTCPGDSGGPIEGRHEDYYLTKVIYGVTSFGKACGVKGSPGIYTKVYPYVSWIENIVWPN